jgi:hypothetical protein
MSRLCKSKPEILDLTRQSESNEDLLDANAIAWKEQTYGWAPTKRIQIVRSYEKTPRAEKPCPTPPLEDEGEDESMVQLPNMDALLISPITVR